MIRLDENNNIIYTDPMQDEFYESTIEEILVADEDRIAILEEKINALMIENNNLAKELQETKNILGVE